MSDLILRTNALGQMARAECGLHYEDCEANNCSCSYIKRILGIPPAEAEWIPVSERLPEDSGNYLITVADLRLGQNGEHTVTMADFYAKAKKWNSIVDVYAWMPLPKPYREENE